jgi:hypothetical protein
MNPPDGSLASLPAAVTLSRILPQVSSVRLEPLAWLVATIPGSGMGVPVIT